jgi:hypothetical protein
LQLLDVSRFTTTLTDRFRWRFFVGVDAWTHENGASHANTVRPNALRCPDSLNGERFNEGMA